jgi:hypothetical protein
MNPDWALTLHPKTALVPRHAALVDRATLEVALVQNEAFYGLSVYKCLILKVMAPRHGFEPQRSELFSNQQLADSKISYISRILLKRPHSYGIRTASPPDLVGCFFFRHSALLVAFPCQPPGEYTAFRLLPEPLDAPFMSLRLAYSDGSFNAVFSRSCFTICKVKTRKEFKRF